MKRFLHEKHRKVKSLDWQLALEGIVFLSLCFYLPILLFYSPSSEHLKHEEDVKIIVKNVPPTVHRLDWDKYLNPKRVAQASKEELVQFHNETITPILGSIEEEYVKHFASDKVIGKKIERKVESDF